VYVDPISSSGVVGTAQTPEDDSRMDQDGVEEDEEDDDDEPMDADDDDDDEIMYDYDDIDGEPSLPPI
jgi:hypothetical protein